jgi:hypothetical protein
MYPKLASWCQYLPSNFCYPHFRLSVSIWFDAFGTFKTLSQAQALGRTRMSPASNYHASDMLTILVRHSVKLRVGIWEFEEHEPQAELFLLEDIVSPVTLCEATVAGRKRLVTMFLNHVRAMILRRSSSDRCFTEP